MMSVCQLCCVEPVQAMRWVHGNIFGTVQAAGLCSAHLAE